MKTIHKVLFLFLLIFGNLAIAEKLLNPPQAQVSECYHSYQEAANPKTANHVLMAMNNICIKRGGQHVMHKVLTHGSEPTTLILTCIGDNPQKRIFSCQYTTSYENL